ncbi:MAG: glycosyltransferase, partial [Candidatus Marsarchaeota archaeon]|nr:glycosyltransferase [Candidatus Marsarchaeota archaeon]
LGLTPLEAMACGTPVVVSRTSSIPEVVGDAGYYIDDPMDADQVANALKTLLENQDLREGLRNQGLRRAASFSWETVAKRTLNVYESIVP